jgi:multidrug efflux system outer membrane protein
MRQTLWGLVATLALAGCVVGPDYRRPEVSVPSTFRGATPLAAPQAQSFGDLEWWKIYQDEQLQTLIRTALEQNYDLRVAATRILQARAQVTIARSFQFPTADASAAAPYDRLTGGKKPPAPTPFETFTPQGGFSLAWELDLWGKFQRATEAARADLMATEDFQRTVVLTLVGDVARAYFELRELDLELEISKNTLTTRAEYLKLTRAREAGGVATLMDVRQAEQLYYSAAAAVPDAERRVEQKENQISILLGKHPDAVPRGRPLTDQTLALAVPPGLTSDLLARRPDILQAEQQLVAANARIGEAKAQLFPSVVISGFAGAGGAMINGSTFGPLGIFNALPTITLPVFNMGRLQANVDLNEARTQEALLVYQQAILQAFREVSDALVGVRKQREVREQLEATVTAQRDALRLSTMRYEGGVTSFLEVLVTERDLFDAELSLARARGDEVVAVVQLYRALGGGWQTEAPNPSPKAAPDPRVRDASLPGGVVGPPGGSASEGAQPVRVNAPAGDAAAPATPAGTPQPAAGAGAKSDGATPGAEERGVWGGLTGFFRNLFSP